MPTLHRTVQAVMSYHPYWRKLLGRASDWHKKELRVDVTDPLSGNLCDQYMRERYYQQENLQKKIDFSRTQVEIDKELIRVCNLKAALIKSYEKQTQQLVSTRFPFPILMNQMQITGRLGQTNMQKQFCKAWQVKAAHIADLQNRKRKYSMRSVEV